ncbi:protein-tyrosine phosphatase family protein [Actinomycetospora straminea]|uniref:Protein-tyrosine phosphatase family protein n=1 Tax=Actinomycetospora straminea TaxID=663607 RepID=A0ABP9EMM9_9PSEU|nr:protein-tyrosine phosphatase family protein [Actinomycetospora straminea]MDD7933261.1 protein-tyrosine phosphatase family protein [Actinomycetospora straminea]
MAARDVILDDWRAALVLPGGTVVRGRGVENPLPGGSTPDYGLYLGVDYTPTWSHGWLDWPDFGIPNDPLDAARAIERLHRYARAGRRVEAACRAGKGRTGTVIACLAILDGLPADHAVSWTRQHFHHRATQTPWQRRWVRRFPALREQVARPAR